MKTRKDVAALMEFIFKECQQAREAGQKEYAHDEANALQNFEDEARNFQVSREVVWGVFAGKHWRGIRAYINGHRSQREDVRGRIRDLIVYLVLLWAMVDDSEFPPTRVNQHEMDRQRDVSHAGVAVGRTTGDDPRNY